MVIHVIFQAYDALRPARALFYRKSKAAADRAVKQLNRRAEKPYYYYSTPLSMKFDRGI